MSESERLANKSAVKTREATTSQTPKTQATKGGSRPSYGWRVNKKGGPLPDRPSVRR
ncbi:hypothetical protein GCM10022276_12610 [Sphingomonas limnosediminicola]|uniref:Uncharacterized protein n=1 Tax=Sphingomonas limnosediminicola TaxID=940133 RepID=A0ABP7L4T3_9SPHN